MKKFSLRRCLGDLYTWEMERGSEAEEWRYHREKEWRQIAYDCMKLQEMLKRYYTATKIHCFGFGHALVNEGNFHAKNAGQTKDIHTCQLCRKAYAVRRPKSKRRVKVILWTDVTANVCIFDDTFLWWILMNLLWMTFRDFGNLLWLSLRELSFLSRLQHHYFPYTRMRQTRRDLFFTTFYSSQITYYL